MEETVGAGVGPPLRKYRSAGRLMVVIVFRHCLVINSHYGERLLCLMLPQCFAESCEAWWNKVLISLGYGI